MKSYEKLLTIIVLTLIFQSCKNTSDTKSYVLTVDIKNVKDSTKVYLYNYENLDSVDSTIVINEQFVFKGSVPYPSRAIINIDEKRGFSFWIENAALHIKTSEKELLSQGYGRVIQTIEGGTINALDKEYTKSLATIKNSIATKSEEFKADGYSVHEQRVLDSLDTLLDAASFSFFIKNADNYFSLSSLAENPIWYSKDSIEAYYRLLSDPLKISVKGKVLSDYIYKKPIVIGKEFVDIKGLDIEGKDMSLSDFKGKTILLNFWAGWCLPCVKKIKKVFPTIEATYGHENFVIVNFSFDYESSMWKKMSKKLKINGANFTNHIGFGDNPVQIDYGVYVIPTSFIIDEKGIVIKRLEYEDDIVKELEEVFKQK